MKWKASKILLKENESLKTCNYNIKLKSQKIHNNTHYLKQDSSPYYVTSEFSTQTNLLKVTWRKNNIKTKKLPNLFTRLGLNKKWLIEGVWTCNQYKQMHIR